MSYMTYLLTSSRYVCRGMDRKDMGPVWVSFSSSFTPLKIIGVIPISILSTVECSISLCALLRPTCTLCLHSQALVYLPLTYNGAACNPPAVWTSNHFNSRTDIYNLLTKSDSYRLSCYYYSNHHSISY